MSNPDRWRLWKIVRRRGLTMSDFADMIGYSREHLHRVKSGDRPLSRALKIIIADSLNLPADFLFSEEEE